MAELPGGNDSDKPSVWRTKSVGAMLQARESEVGGGSKDSAFVGH